MPKKKKKNLKDEKELCLNLEHIQYIDILMINTSIP